MPTEDKMTIDERRKYLRIQQQRYRNATRRERGVLLDDMEHVTGLNRKALIRLMASDLKRRPRRKQRKRTYGADVDDVLRVIIDSYGHLCAERLTPSLVWMAEHLVSHGELTVSQETLQKLSTISVSTVHRILKRITQDMPRLSRKRPKSTNLYARGIPMKRIPWDESTPGYLEVDLVHHCGSSASGEYVHTLQMVDVATGWSERAALLGRSYVAMKGAFRIVLVRIPFLVHEVHSDSGSEFLNSHLLRFWGEAAAHIRLSRSRPYQKNDNRFVEQKNNTLVRAYLGYDRLDSVAQVLAINELYDKLWLYDNFFQPVMRLKEKLYIPDGEGGTRIRRRFDQAKTPFDRLCATGVLSQDRQQELEELRNQTNPRQLRKEIDQLIDHIFSLPGAITGVTEDVYETLLSPTSPMKGEGVPVTLSFDRTTALR